MLFVEGEGDVDAAPKLIGRLLNEQSAWDAVYLDANAFRLGHVSRILKDDCREWKRKLEAALKRKNVGGVLLLLDGDFTTVGPNNRCVADCAKYLANVAASVGAGATFSVGVVFARQEFESWFIAGIESVAGSTLPDGRQIATGLTAPADTDENPRGAKHWLHARIEGGYKETRDQGPITEMLDIELLRGREVRSFRRLESALAGIVSAVRDELPVATPC